MTTKIITPTVEAITPQDIPIKFQPALAALLAQAESEQTASARAQERPARQFRAAEPMGFD